MIVGSLDPFITTGLAFFLLKNRLTYNKFIGILLGTFSIILLFYFDQNLLFFQFGFSQFMAILCGILAIAIGRYGWMKSQALLVSNRYTVFEINFIILIGGGIASFLLTWFFTSESSMLNIALDTKRVVLLLYTTIIGNVLFYYIYSSALKKYSIVSISYCGLIIPFSGHFLGWIFLDEPLSTTFFFAIFMIFLGYRFYFLPTEKKPFLLKENSN